MFQRVHSFFNCSLSRLFASRKNRNMGCASSKEDREHDALHSSRRTSRRVPVVISAPADANRVQSDAAAMPTSKKKKKVKKALSSANVDTDGPPGAVADNSVPKAKAKKNVTKHGKAKKVKKAAPEHYGDVATEMASSGTMSQDMLPAIPDGAASRADANDEADRACVDAPFAPHATDPLGDVPFAPDAPFTPAATNPLGNVPADARLPVVRRTSSSGTVSFTGSTRHRLSRSRDSRGSVDLPLTDGATAPFRSQRLGSHASTPTADESEWSHREE